MRAEEIVMRIPSQWKKLFITMPFLLAIFLLAAAKSRVGATGPSAPFILPLEAYVPSGYTASFVAVGDLNSDGNLCASTISLQS
jgi:hypothetical protein